MSIRLGLFYISSPCLLYPFPSFQFSLSKHLFSPHISLFLIEDNLSLSSQISDETWHTWWHLLLTIYLDGHGQNNNPYHHHYSNRYLSISLFFLCVSLVSWLASAPGPVLDFGPERGPGKGTMADLGPLIRHLVSTRLPSGGRAAFFVSFVPLGRH